MDAAARAAQRAVFLRVFPSIMLPMFMAALDQTIVATALPAIAGDLSDVERISWVVVSYLIAATIAAPVYGRLGDALGRRRMIFYALGLFLLASGLCAASRSILMLSFFRVLQGFGGGGLLTLCQAIIGETVPPRDRGRYQGYLSTIFVSASTFGPVAGGYLTQAFGWQSVFAINLPLGAIAFALALRLPKRAAPRGKFQLDALGTLFFAVFVTATLLAIERFQRFEASSIPLIAALAAVAVASVALLLRQERRTASPLLPLKLFAQASIWRADLMAFFLGGTIISLISFLPIYLQVVRGLSPSETGFLMLPLTAGIGTGALFTGSMIARTQRTAIFPSFGLPITATALFGLAFAVPYLGNYALPWVFALVSLTLGTGMPVVQVITQVVAGPKLLGSAAASVQFSRSVGGGFGAAITGAVLFAAIAASDPATASIFAELLQRGPSVLSSLDPARHAVVSGEIADAFRAAFITIGLYCSGAVLLAWWQPTRRL
jgi:EmrB/QacA subfamily drug resistance transporter